MIQEADKENANPRIVYVSCDGVYSSVYRSQVVGFVRQLRERGFPVELIVFSNALGMLKHPNVKSLMPSRYGSEGAIRLTVPSYGDFGCYLASRMLSSIIARDLGRGMRTILHCRGEVSVQAAAPLRARWQNLRLIYDARGEKLSEFDYYLNAERPFIDRLVARPKRERFLRFQRTAVQAADLVLAVSEPLNDYLKSLSPSCGNRIKTLRTGTDERIFRLVPETERDAARTELGLAGKRVALYSGGMQAYQNFAKTAEIFKAIREEDPRAFFLVCTPSRGLAEEVLRGVGLSSGDFAVVSKKHEELPKLFGCADVGFLLREELPLNRFASPTKLGEYWLSGLPVVTTNALADAAVQIKANPLLGELIALDRSASWIKAWRAVADLSAENRISIREAALPLYGRLGKLDEYVGFLDKL